MDNISTLRPQRVRTVWISDIYLGFRRCSADLLLDFLHRVECGTHYLIGDIVDVWNLRRGICWPQAHNNIIRRILGKAKHGTCVIFAPGNHDELFRDHVDLQFGNVEIAERAVHETRDGRRLLIVHGGVRRHRRGCGGSDALVGHASNAVCVRCRVGGTA